jgi:TetR/AcrR family transcriptional regulator, transcriptional repressor for nem operon
MPKTKQFDKDKVLEAAAAVFQQKGYNGTSIDEILKVTGLSRSSLYDSFVDKHTLYLQALEFYKSTERKEIEIINGNPLNGFEKIKFFFDEIVNHIVNHPEDNGCLMVNAAVEMSKRCDKTAKVICKNKEDIKELFTHWLKDAELNNAINLTRSADHYGAFLFVSLCGLKVLSQSGASREDLNNVVNVTLEAIV